MRDDGRPQEAAAPAMELPGDRKRDGGVRRHLILPVCMILLDLVNEVALERQMKELRERE
jgi:hypothetical protein